MIPQLLSAASKKEILIRMLRNLKGVYLQKNDFQRGLSVIDRILLIAPDMTGKYVTVVAYIIVWGTAGGGARFSALSCSWHRTPRMPRPCGR